jgi:hypothetical protein
MSPKEDNRVSLIYEAELDPDFDLRKFAYGVMDLAKTNLQNDGFLTPAVFLVQQDRISAYAMQFDGADEKYEVYTKVVEIARAKHAHAIVTLNDVYKDEADPATYMQDKFDTERAAEAIMVTVSGPAIPGWALDCGYVRSPGGLRFSPAQEEKIRDFGLLPGWAEQNPTVN